MKNKFEETEHIVIESFVESSLSFIYTSGQLALWNATIQKRIQQAELAAASGLQDLVWVKTEVNKRFLTRRG